MRIICVIPKCEFVCVQIWQKVKAANPNLSVCEVGATIGRMWRELTDVDKQGYNADFAIDKVNLSSHILFSSLDIFPINVYSSH